MAPDTAEKVGKATPPTFQDVIMNLQRYWASTGCVVLQPYDNEVGAGTNAPATTLRSLGPDTWRTAYVQGCRRPTDGRYGENPNRGQFYYQFQVLMKPSPDNIQDLYLGSLRAIGIDTDVHDVRFVEDDNGRVLRRLVLLNALFAADDQRLLSAREVVVRQHGVDELGFAAFEEAGNQVDWCKFLFAHALNSSRSAFSSMCAPMTHRRPV
mgnify:CR=1 FL=1